MKKCFAIFAAAFFLALSHPSLAAEKIHSSVMTSSTAPSAVAPITFVDENDIQHALSDYRGRFVLLNIWATWCAPCAREMQSLNELQSKFDKKAFVVLPVSQNADIDTVSAFYKTKHLNNLPIAVDRQGVSYRAFNLRGLPTTILINPSGQEIARKEGEAEWGSAISEISNKTLINPLK